MPAGGTPSAAAARPAAEAAAGHRRLHGRPAQRGPAGRARRQAAPGALRPGLRRRRPLDQLLGGQVDHLHPGGRRAARRPHPQHGRQGHRLHPADERLGVRRREHPPAADDDLGRALERGLRRPELGRGAVQQPQARRRRRRARELPAPLAARRCRPARAGTTAPAKPTWSASWSARRRRSPWPPTCPKRSGCRPAWSSRRPGSSAAPGRRSAAAASRPRRATTRASACSSSAARASTARASCRTAGWPKPRPRAPASASPDRGYGYQWWTYADGSFAARGIFGQGIFIDPKRKIVIASNANWAGGARDPAASGAREAFYLAVQKAVDDEAASAGSPK